MNSLRGRKRSGIKMELVEKLNEWLESIADESVRKAAKGDCIVTGGAIASMLLGEAVNDFDIYFRTKSTSLVVANYYANKFNVDNNPVDRAQVREESVRNIRDELEDRISIFIASSGVAAETRQYKDGEEKPKYRPVFLSQNAITLSDKFQLITRFYGEPAKIHDNYDFVHTTCYFDLRNDALVFPADAMEAMLSRSLIYRGSLYPVASIFRTKKFIERGWRISAGEQLKIMWQISEIDLSDVGIMREQLTGVDQAFMCELIHALEGVDQAKITSRYVTTIIDKMFE